MNNITTLNIGDRAQAIAKYHALVILSSNGYQPPQCEKGNPLEKKKKESLVNIQELIRRRRKVTYLRWNV